MECAEGYLTNVSEDGTITFQIESDSLLMLVEFEHNIEQHILDVSYIWWKGGCGAWRK